VIIDASTIFVLAVTTGLIVLLGWAEVYSRRHHNPNESPGGAASSDTDSSGRRAKPAKRR
jgi:hypothetical protein